MYLKMVERVCLEGGLSGGLAWLVMIGCVVSGWVQMVF